MATITEQVAAIRVNATAFFQRIVDLSNASPPPGPNAANGWFRDAMVSDGELTSLLQRPDIVTDADPLLVLNDFTSFGADIRNGFHPENHNSAWFGNFQLLKEALLRYGAVAIKVISDIFAALGPDTKERQDARTKVGTDIQALIDAVGSKGAVLSGTHANGWIQVGVREAGGRGAASFLDAAGRMADADAKQLVAVLLQLATAIRDTGDRDMTPWLDAQWQVEFQSKVQAAAAALRTV